ncbi:MAG: MG2 domain-containing protein [Prevotella sp.]|nr:MG2 domain-containing protein [Prevotella sp.]
MRRLITILIVLIEVASMKAVDIRNAIVEYYAKCPQEKIFVHTDKNQYMAGDTVWFRAHLVDAMTMMEKCESRFVYIELYDDAMKMLERHMVKADSLGVFANALRLSPQLKTGAYTLVAYTQWMQNFPNKRFFYKRLMIADKEAREVKTDEEVTYVGGSTYDIRDVKSAINVSQRNERLVVKYEADMQEKKPLSLVVIGSGNLIVVDSLKEKSVSFREKELCCGTVNIAIVDSETGKLIAERLAYIKGAGLPEVSATMQSSDESGAMSIDVMVTNCEGTPLAGDFSISITDADIVERDTTQQDIAAYMLMGSEMEPMNRKVVELFREQSQAGIAKLDHMASQEAGSWLSMSKMLSGETPKNKYDIQRDQRISGIVQGTIRKKIKTPSIMLLNPMAGTLERYELPSSTHFNLVGMDFPEGVNFMLEAARYNGSDKLIELKIDSPSFPTPYPVMTTANKRILTGEFLKYERMQAAINGLNDINYLEELEVTGHKKSADDNRKAFSPWREYNRSVDGAPIHKDMRTWLQSMGYRFTRDRNNSISNLNSTVIWVDGFRTDLGDLLNIDPSSVKRINYYLERDGRITLPNSIPSAYDNGTRHLYVELTNIKNASDNSLAIKTIHPLGYMPSVSCERFSRPKAEGQIDMRTTLFWSPYVSLSQEGKASVKFYPSDTSSKYRITIQGISNNGQVISKELEIKMK